MRNWLSDVTRCEVNYKWIDLGIRYYPRYVAKGYCDQQQSCSIPEGMYCQPNDERRINFFR